MRDRFVSLFPYKGGKTALVKQVVPLIEWAITHYKLSEFCEACGGSGKYITNMSLPYNIRKTYLELDNGVVKLVSVLKNRRATQLLIERLLSFNYTEDEYYYMKANYHREDLDIITVAAFTYIYIRLSWRNALTNYGEEKILGKVNYFKKDIREIGEKRFDIILDGVNILQGDCLQYISSNLERNDLFISLDVPYPNTTGYPANKRYGEFDYNKLIDLLLKTNSKVLINGYDTDIYNELILNGWHKVGFINDNFTKGTTKEEYLWINFDIGEPTMKRLDMEYII